jgi:hypothetical protein
MRFSARVMLCDGRALAPTSRELPRKGLMPSRIHRIATCVVTSLALAIASHAAAQDHELRVATTEVGSWPDTIAALQRDMHSQGNTVHVIVFDSGAHVAPCGRYSLALDPAGANAFTAGACDPSTNATPLTLRSRTDLFSHDGPVPRPRTVRLLATEVRYGDTEGGAAMTGGAALECSVGIRPYLDDLEHGGVVYLTNDRYEVRPSQASIMVSVEPTGWSLHGRAASALTIAYDVVDRTTGEVVLHDSATLACSSGSSSPGLAPAPSAPRASFAPGTESAASSRVVLLETADLPRPAEVVEPLDIHEPVGDERTAMRMMREAAAAVGADAVVGVEFHHGHGGGPIHLSGLAVRWIDLSRR